jgi:hypothetical protein
MHRIVLLAALVALAPALAGCEDFDMEKFDFLHLNDKKKLPGERKELFPQGVPGVTQGIPPEYQRGNQPPPGIAQAPAPADTAAATPGDKAATPAPSARSAAVEPTPELKPKPKRKPKPRTAARPATQVTVQPAAQGQGSDQQQMAPWPGSTPQQPASGQSTSTNPWPSAPAPGTFSR